MPSLPLQFLLLTVAGWMTRDHQRVTEYLLAENSLLREQLRGRRILYTDAQRRRLATAAKRLGRKALKQLDTLVTPDTLFRWYRHLVARKYDGTGSRGATSTRRTPDIVELVLRMAKENGTIGSVRCACLARVIPLGERHLRQIIREYLAHYHTERNTKVSPTRSSLRGTTTPPAAATLYFVSVSAAC